MSRARGRQLQEQRDSGDIVYRRTASQMAENPRPRKENALQLSKVLRELANRYFHRTERIIPVQDNLNTRSHASPYEAFQTAEAARFNAQLGVHNTSNRGVCLNIAECELSA